MMTVYMMDIAQRACWQVLMTMYMTDMGVERVRGAYILYL